MLAHHVRGALDAAQRALDRRILRHVDDAHGELDLVAGGALERPVAVPPLGHVLEQP